MKLRGHRMGGVALSACAIVVACGGSASPGAPKDAGDGADGGPEATTGAEAGVDAGGDAGIVIGTPCIPSAESLATFDGFDNEEVSLSATTTSGAPTCVVDHFRGLVTCPYGQTATGQPPAGASACTTTDGQPVVGAVEPQCVDRPAAKVVIWSCRCANAQGQTDDGRAYCACPPSTACTPLVSSVGGEEDDLSGAYCVPPAALLDGGAVCAVSCSPTAAPCP
jgi:hypothetical protein